MALPILELPNTRFIGGRGFDRFQFTKPAERLIVEFDRWYEANKGIPGAVLCFLSHQKNEVFDMKDTTHPFTMSECGSLRNMERFFRHVLDNYGDKGVRFTSARDAIERFRTVYPTHTGEQTARLPSDMTTREW